VNSDSASSALGHVFGMRDNDNRMTILVQLLECRKYFAACSAIMRRSAHPPG
jgi:hypothetical protein